MTKQKAAAVCLVLFGALLAASILYMTIHSGLRRSSSTQHNIAKLVIITAANGRSVVEQDAAIRRIYEEFLSCRVDVELAFSRGREEMLIGLEKLLNLSSSFEQELQVEGHLLSEQRKMYDELFVWLSPEGSELDPESETQTKQLYVMTIERVWISNLMERLRITATTASGQVDMLAIEAWTDTGSVKIQALYQLSSDFVQIGDFASLDSLRSDLCPMATLDASECRF